MSTKIASNSDDVSFYRWDALIRKYAARYNVPWRWVKAVMLNESHKNLKLMDSVARGLASPDDVEGSASDDKKSWGLMQVTLPTANDYRGGTTPQDLNNPEISFDIGTKHLRFLFHLFSGDRRRVIMSYNQGQGNTLAGKEYAAEYYARFTRNLELVQQKQPGNELET